MTLTEGVPVAEGSQLSLTLKQKASETREWGPGPREPLEGAGSQTEMIISQDPKPHQNLPGTVAEHTQLDTPKTRSTIGYLFGFKGINLKVGESRGNFYLRG